MLDWVVKRGKLSQESTHEPGKTVVGFAIWRERRGEGVEGSMGTATQRWSLMQRLRSQYPYFTLSSFLSCFPLFQTLFPRYLLFSPAHFGPSRPPPAPLCCLPSGENTTKPQRSQSNQSRTLNLEHHLPAPRPRSHALPGIPAHGRKAGRRVSLRSHLSKFFPPSSSTVVKSQFPDSKMPPSVNVFTGRLDPFSGQHMLRQNLQPPFQPPYPTKPPPLTPPFFL